MKDKPATIKVVVHAQPEYDSERWHEYCKYHGLKPTGDPVRRAALNGERGWIYGDAIIYVDEQRIAIDPDDDSLTYYGNFREKARNNERYSKDEPPGNSRTSP